MLELLRIRNFRCFDDHNVALRRTSIIVGRNNAGKSTLVEALKLVAIVAARFRNSSYRNPPDWSNLPLRDKGIRPALVGFDLADHSVFHNYQQPPAVIEATFKGGPRIEVYVGPESQVHAVVRDAAGAAVGSKSTAQQLRSPSLSFLPPIGPIRASESLLTLDHVRSSINSPLAPHHFRNQMFHWRKHYGRFRTLCGELWPSVQIREFTRSASSGDELALLIRDGEFVAEAGKMGHGLQVWMQIVWYLARTDPSTTVLLDEPDVYLHADLQRKLIRILRGKYRQVLLATHSIEIMSEVEPDEILVVERRRPESRYADTLGSVQRVIDRIGGVHNIHLYRLSSSKRCLVVEGHDAKLLQKFQDKLHPRSAVPFGTLPKVSIGGWGGWSRAIGSSMAMRNAFGERIKVYCLLDRDFYHDEEIHKRYEDARAAGVQLHVWQRKELENYLLVPAAIQRAIAGQTVDDVEPPTVDQVRTSMLDACNALQDNTLDSLADAYTRKRRGTTPKAANKYARMTMKQWWTDDDTKLARTSGKAVLTGLAAWSQSTFKVTLTAPMIARSLRIAEVPPEMRKVVGAIEQGRRLPPSWLES